MLCGAYATGVVTWTQIGQALGVTGSVAWHLAHPAGMTTPLSDQFPPPEEAPDEG